jgi:hypothetical protein
MTMQVIQLHSGAAGSTPQTVLSRRCDDCAFAAGTDASKSIWTASVAKLCVAAGTSFECHGPHDGRMCRGFYDAFAAKLASGYYATLPAWKRDVFLSMIDVLQDFRADSDNGHQWSSDESAAKLHAAVKAALAESEGS